MQESWPPNTRCESDLAQLVKAINLGSSYTEVVGVITDIISAVSSFECFSWSWISRESNRYADNLAKQCLAVELAIMAPPNFG